MTRARRAKKETRAKQARRGRPVRRARQARRGRRETLAPDFLVKGYYGSVSALQASVKNPEVGDAYGVGAAAPYDIYIYDGVTGAWINNGTLQGAKGEKGEKGDKGDPGAKGEPGETGPQGPTGPQGKTGPQGPTGPAGDNGAPGANGVTPTIGTNGNWYLGETDTGKPSRGEKGDKGDKGPQGEQGETGGTGAAGTTFTPSVAADGTLSWTNDGGKTNPDSVNIKGPQGNPGEKGNPGETGAKGADGVTPTIGANGNWYLEDTDTGKPSRGEKGDKGDPGAQGPAGATPVKGTDYFTEADKQEIASAAAGLVDLSGKQNKITAAGILKGDGAGGVSAAKAGTDYATPAQVAAKQDVLLASGASVGDLIKVKAVDASGKPTAWAVAVAGTDYMKTGNITKQTLVSAETTPTENYAINWQYE